MTPWQLRRRAACGLVSGVLWASVVTAQDPQATATPETAPCDEDPKGCGRQAFDAGVAAYKERQYKDAQQHFERALGYQWHPAIAMNLALSLKEDGQLMAALQVLERILAHEDTTPSLAKAAETHRRLADEQLAEVEVINGGGETITLTVDGKVVATSTEGIARLDPGTHQVDVAVNNQPPTRRQITFAPAERVRLQVSPTREIVLSVPTPSAVNATRPVPPPDEPRTEPPANGLSPVFFYVGCGLTAALGAVTVWSGLDTKTAFDSYEQDLPNLNQAQINERVDQGHSKETRTNVLIGVTAGSAAATAVLGALFTQWGGTATSASLSAGPNGASARIRATF